MSFLKKKKTLKIYQEWIRYRIFQVKIFFIKCEYMLPRGSVTNTTKEKEKQRTYILLKK